MSRLIFDHEPQTWQELEALIFQAFSEMLYETYRDREVTTVRGTVAIDVHATKKSTPIPTVVLCECKYWNKAVDQNVIYSFRSICSDAGAHYGLIVSKKGFQASAHESREFTNIHLLDFVEFQNTFFDEWRSGVFMEFARLCDQVSFLLPGNPYYAYDKDLKMKLEGVDVFEKYSIFFGAGRYTDYFIERREFPVKMVDPRGDAHVLDVINVKSPREYFEIGKQAVKDLRAHFSPGEPDKSRKESSF
jgi:hypothetical protein